MNNDLSILYNLLIKQGVLPAGFSFIFFAVLLYALMIWSIAWKGLALWKSARNNHQWWFIGLLIINTVGILDLIYIFVFGKKKETKEKKEEEK